MADATAAIPHGLVGTSSRAMGILRRAERATRGRACKCHGAPFIRCPDLGKRWHIYVAHAPSPPCWREGDLMMLVRGAQEPMLPRYVAELALVAVAVGRVPVTWFFCATPDLASLGRSARECRALLREAMALLRRPTRLWPTIACAIREHATWHRSAVGMAGGARCMTHGCQICTGANEAKIFEWRLKRD